RRARGSSAPARSARTTGRNIRAQWRSWDGSAPADRARSVGSAWRRWVRRRREVGGLREREGERLAQRGGERRRVAHREVVRIQVADDPITHGAAHAVADAVVHADVGRGGRLLDGGPL